MHRNVMNPESYRQLIEPGAEIGAKMRAAQNAPPAPPAPPPHPKLLEQLVGRVRDAIHLQSVINERLDAFLDTVLGSGPSDSCGNKGVAPDPGGHIDHTSASLATLETLQHRCLELLTRIETIA